MDVRELRRLLVRKLGAEEDRVRDHIYFFLNIRGRQYRVGKLSHSFRGQVSDFVIADTAKRLKLSKKEFNQFVDCPLSRDEVVRLWTGRDP